MYAYLLTFVILQTQKIIHITIENKVTNNNGFI